MLMESIDSDMMMSQYCELGSFAMPHFISTEEETTLGYRAMLRLVDHSYYPKCLFKKSEGKCSSQTAACVNVLCYIEEINYQWHKHAVM